MKKFIPLMVLLCLIFFSSSQSAAQTIINKYAAVLSLGPCNSIVVDTANDFVVGDTVLMIQMKGAVIDTTNSSVFGNILNYHSAGNYEYNVIKLINGNTIGFKYLILRPYDIPNGKVQLVKVPSYINYTVNQPHTCMPWNGSKGGVFAIYTTGTLTLNNSINLTAKGFRGGQIALSTQYSGCNNADYFYPATGNLAGQKGEGIAEISIAKMYGRGALANAGGGGGNHNAGGAGGGNAGAGGTGGNQYQLGGCNPYIADIGGVGGKVVIYNPVQNRIFLGGGGGSGHGNDLAEKPGAVGGGIAIINCGNLVSASGSIVANGGDAIECSSATPGCQNDATGGGGGGGTILIKSGSYTGSLSLSAKGGKGANVWMGPTTPVGPGGGGGGGAIIYAQAALPGSTTNDVSPGIAGILPQFGNTNWGAQPGQPGQTLTGFSLIFPVDTFSASGVIADFSFTRTDCYTFSFTDQSSSVSGPINSRLWDFSDSPTSTLQNPSHTFPDYGSYDVTLTVSNANGCSNVITKQVNIPYDHFAEAGPDVSVCLGKSVSLQASGGVDYSWNPPTGLSNATISNPDATLSASVTYVVTVTDNFGCIDMDTVLVNVAPGPSLEVSSEGSGVSCDKKSLQLFATGAESYSWSPGMYCDDSTSASPKVSPPGTVTFTVTGTNTNGCTATDTITVYQYLGESNIFMPNAFSPNGDGLNDEIKPIVLCDFSLDLFAIYNRWGQRVFSTHDPRQGWDGFFHDKNSDSGVYYYYISGKRNNGSPVEMKGDISLIR